MNYRLYGDQWRLDGNYGIHAWLDCDALALHLDVVHCQGRSPMNVRFLCVSARYRSALLEGRERDPARKLARSQGSITDGRGNGLVAAERML